MNLDTIKERGLKVFKFFIPNLFLFISEKEIEDFIEKGYHYTLTLKEGTPLNNFLGLFFQLITNPSNPNSTIIRNEFGIFNMLIGKFFSLAGKHRSFSNLLLGNIKDFQQNNFLNTLSEIGAVLKLVENYGYSFLNYETSLPNGKTIDFELLDLKSGNIILIDVVSINFDPKRYENKEGFEKIIEHRLKSKYDSKVTALDFKEKTNIYIFPVYHDVSGLHKLSQQILVDNKSFLISINPENDLIIEGKCFAIHFFVTLEFKRYNLVSAQEYYQLLPKKK